MSGLRLSLSRLPPLVVLALPALFLACTAPTADYCDNSGQRDCAGGKTCDLIKHTCRATIDAQIDASGDGVADTAPPIDAPADHAPDGGAAGDSGTAVDSHADRADGAADGADAADVHTGCSDNQGCLTDPTKPVCEKTSGLCVGCLQNPDCTKAGALVCDKIAKKCVQCLLGSDCTDPTTPVCDTQICRGCRVDSECAATGPGICMSHLDGHCATDSETVYVENLPAPGCSDIDPAAGTRQLPFCSSQIGINATVAPIAEPPGDAGTDAGRDAGSDGGAPSDGPAQKLMTKSLVIMSGPSLQDWAYNTAGRTITVVGQRSASVSPGARIGVHVSAGTVYVRGLRVSGSTATQPGVVADGGELHLDRCVVDSNQAGGVLINGAAFDITNTVIANNSGTTTGACGAWAGACILNKPQAGPGRFLNNTVAANGLVGVACGSAYPVLGSIVTGSTGTIDIVNCAFATCCGTGPTNIDPLTYHLMAGSSCIDKLAVNASTAYDIDGQARPFGTLSDCGADEYVTP